MSWRGSRGVKYFFLAMRQSGRQWPSGWQRFSSCFTSLKPPRVWPISRPGLKFGQRNTTETVFNCCASILLVILQPRWSHRILSCHNIAQVEAVHFLLHQWFGAVPHEDVRNVLPRGRFGLHQAVAYLDCHITQIWFYKFQSIFGTLRSQGWKPLCETPWKQQPPCSILNDFSFVEQCLGNRTAPLLCQSLAWLRATESLSLESRSRPTLACLRLKTCFGRVYFNRCPLKAIHSTASKVWGQQKGSRSEG